MKYNQLEVEKKWQEKWLEDKTYEFDINAKGEVYAIDNPPSFTSGTLHMGHVLNHAWIDFIARYKRMRGYNVLFPIGYDCHGLPTEIRVEKEYGVSKENRKEFRAKCEEWTTQAIKKMDEQFRRIGYSADWKQYYETRMDSYKKKVQYSLLKFFEMNRVYREKHPVLWCPKCETALAKAEVSHVQEQGKLWHLTFPVVEGGTVTIATTRPEMLFACVGVFVHPEDKRYKKLHKKHVKIPYINKEVSILTDDKVDMEFGTGIVYVCTFGDEMDIAWQKEFKLEVVEAIDKKGHMTEVCGEFAGMFARKAQKKVVEKLKADGILTKEEDYEHNVLCHTERAACQAHVELLPMHQYFIKVRDKREDVKKAAQTMKWFPKYMLGRLEDWSDSMDWDWIISRQRVYGTPIPFWYCDKCAKITPAKESQLPVDTTTDKPPIAKCECGGKLVGTLDVCDCWVDSSISPLVVAHWLEKDGVFEKAYPNYLRPQGYEIIRTWAFYTIFRDTLLTGKPPFKHVVVNGMVAGSDGRKMSKSYNNVVAPEEVLDTDGADSVRQWSLMASLGEDYPWDLKEITHSSKFLKKYWNASRFASGFIEDVKKPKALRAADKWILHKLNSLIKECTSDLDAYEFAKALNKIRTFFWHDFCDFYLEMVKDRVYNDKDKEAAQFALKEVLLKTSLLFAPFIPHMTEEVHDQFLKKFTKAKSIHLLEWPEADKAFIDEDAGALGDKVADVIAAVRKHKSDKSMPLNSEIGVVSVNDEKLLNAKQDIMETVKAKDVVFKKGDVLAIVKP